jgi:hypothetical protein
MNTRISADSIPAATEFTTDDGIVIPYKASVIPNPYGRTMYGVQVGKYAGSVVGLVKHNEDKWDGYVGSKPVAVGCRRWTDAAEAVLAAWQLEKARRNRWASRTGRAAA